MNRKRKSKSPIITLQAAVYNPPAVLLYPAHGCEAAGSLTDEQMAEKLRQTRQMLRQHWGHPGVKAAVELLELRANYMVRQSLVPAAGEFGRGEASGASIMASVLREVFLSREHAPEEAAGAEG